MFVFITCSEFRTWKDKRGLFGLYFYFSRPGDGGCGVMQTDPIGFSKNGFAYIVPV